MKELKVLYVLTLVLVALVGLYVYQNTNLTGFVVANQTTDVFFPEVDQNIGKLNTIDVVCNGLLYANVPNDTTCKNGILVQPKQEFGQFNCAEESDCKIEGYVCAVPGLCERSVSGLSISVLFDIPKFLERGKVIDARLIFVNTGKTKIKLDPKVSLYGLEVYSENVLLKTINLDLDPEERKEVQVKVKGINISDSFTSFDLEKSTININFGEEDDVFWSAYVYDPQTAKACGNSFWNYDGVCYENVFYPQGDCVVGSGCIDNINKNIRESDVSAFGNKTAVFVTVNLKQEDRRDESYYLSLGKKISDWYDRESARLTGKDLMNLNFEFGGDLILTYWSEDNLKQQIEKMFPDADFILVVLPDLETTEYGGFTGGLYYFGGFITLNSKNMDEISVAHELAHGFGCEDLYGIQHLGNTRLNNNLLITPVWISGDLLGLNIERGLNNKVLGGCAAEIGWRDYDKDGIVDVVDQSVEEVIPEWLKEIKIENVEIVKNQEREFLVNNYRYFVYPDDVVLVGDVKSGDFPIVANVTVSADGQTEILKCEFEREKFYCFLGSEAKGKMELKASFGILEDEKEFVV